MSKQMRFYLPITAMMPDEAIKFTRRAEDLGYGGVAIPDHLVMPAEIDTSYPYTKDMKFLYALDSPWPDVWVLIGALAAVTQHIRIRTSVFILPLRHPLLVARASGTAAVLSNGRLEFGVGVGWLPDEFAELGVDFSRRGALTDEMIIALRTLWKPGLVHHRGENWDIGPLHLEPAPERSVPLLIGGSSDAALRRAAKTGDGYLMTNGSVDYAIATMDRLRTLLREYDRQDDRFEFHANELDPVPTTVDDYSKLARHGTAAVTVRPWVRGVPLDVKLEAIEQFAKDILDRVDHTEVE